jgi:hypothetical protein
MHSDLYSTMRSCKYICIGRDCSVQLLPYLSASACLNYTQSKEVPPKNMLSDQTLCGLIKVGTDTVVIRRNVFIREINCPIK